VKEQKRFLALVVAVLGSLLLLGLTALAFSAESDYQVTNFLFGGGGTVDSTSKFKLLSAIGEPAAGFAGSLGHSMSPGYIAVIAESIFVPNKVTDLNAPVLPEEYSLSQNYPNPFNPTTQIEFAMPRSGRALLEVYDIMGRRVVTLVDEDLEAGEKQVQWDGRDRYGDEVASGIYLYRLQVNDFAQTKKMVLLK
jgi:hypothetical protein